MASATSTCATRSSIGTRKASHHRTGNAWCILPCTTGPTAKSDSMRWIPSTRTTRPLYDWYLDHSGVRITPPAQIEFAQLNLHR